MKNFTILTNVRMASDVVDGPGWADDANDANDNNKPQHRSQSKAKTGDRSKKNAEV
ncbi:hypothetical protein [Aliterella atlantica]|uniref:hypothetical protein n=1 Tax=Aliterella atlantica TaxID=1827278 RepID=UPI0013649C1E|nr:hypothetical protein [Aliterella atlantica]